MGKLVDLSEHRPHLAGPARCLECKHEWQAVSPQGTFIFECPKCGLLKGVYYGFCSVPDTQIFTCGYCDNQCFTLLSTGHVLCMYCGDLKEYPT